jgi:hypothetical protein
VVGSAARGAPCENFHPLAKPQTIRNLHTTHCLLAPPQAIHNNSKKIPPNGKTMNVPITIIMPMRGNRIGKKSTIRIKDAIAVIILNPYEIVDLLDSI